VVKVVLLSTHAPLRRARPFGQPSALLGRALEPAAGLYLTSRTNGSVRPARSMPFEIRAY